MMKSGIYTCRKLQRSDLETVMHWRMSPQVTQFMNTDPALSLESQVRWFERLSVTDDFYYWMIHADQIPCGVINLADMDTANKRCTWGYYVAEKSFRSFHLAMALEMSLYDYVLDKLGMNKITGESFCINKAAIQMHELCGCQTEGVLRQHIFKNGKYYDICVQSMLAQEWIRIRDSFQYQHIVFES